MENSNVFKHLFWDFSSYKKIVEHDTDEQWEQTEPLKNNTKILNCETRLKQTKNWLGFVGTGTLNVK